MKKKETESFASRSVAKKSRQCLVDIDKIGGTNKSSLRMLSKLTNSSLKKKKSNKNIKIKRKTSPKVSDKVIVWCFDPAGMMPVSDSVIWLLEGSKSLSFAWSVTNPKQERKKTRQK